MKLTKRQGEVIEKMKKGWVLRVCGHWWLQDVWTKERVHTNTAQALRKKELISAIILRDEVCYVLTEKGKEI